MPSEHSQDEDTERDITLFEATDLMRENRLHRIIKVDSGYGFLLETDTSYMLVTLYPGGDKPARWTVI